MAIVFLDHGYGQFNAARRIGPACWDWYDLLFIHSGQVKLSICGDDIELVAPAAVLIQPGSEFQGDAVSGLAEASIQHFMFDGSGRFEDQLAGLLKDLPGYCAYASYRAQRVEGHVHQAIQLAGMEQAQLVRAMRESVLMLEIGTLAGAADRGRCGPVDKLEEVAVRAKSSIGNDICIKDMAGRVGESLSYFRARFKGRFGVSPGKFLIEIRLEEAARRLRETLEPVKQIAWACDYRDLPHFHRSFKAHFGVTPADYRRQTALKG